MSLFFENDTDRVIKKPAIYRWELGEPVKHCGYCKVRINAVPDRYGRITCPNGHLNESPR